MLTREQESGTSNNGSETTETEQTLQAPTLLREESSLSLSGSSSRMILPLPVPSIGAGGSGLAPTPSRSSTSSGTFDAVPTLTNASTSAGANVQSSQRLSPDTSSGTRLPSITAEGLLIEAGLRARSPTTLNHQLDSTRNYERDRLGALPTSPTSLISLGGAFPGPHPGSSDTDSRRRDSAGTTVFPWLTPTEAATVQN